MSKISAGTTTATGLVQTSDTTGNLELQTNNGTTAVTFDTSQNASFASDISVQGGNYLSSQPSFRNLIINGDMKIAQRGTSVTGVTSSGYNTLDRWTNSLGGSGTWTISQDTDVPTGQGFANSFKYDCTTANASITGGNALSVIQHIEAQNLQHLKYGTSSAESMTVSFWVKSNKTGTYIFEVYQWDSNRFISKSYTINSADTWEKKTITIEGDTSGVIDNNNDKGLQLAWWLATGPDNSSGTLQTTWASMVSANRAVGQVNLADSTANYINITGVQLEVGSQATPFEHRPYDVELSRCFRYYWSGQISGGACADDDYSRNILGGNFPVRMRVAPSITIVDGTLLGHHAIAPSGTISVHQDTVAVEWTSTAYRSIGSAGRANLKANAEL